jgi:hypothetical protein
LERGKKKKAERKEERIKNRENKKLKRKKKNQMNKKKTIQKSIQCQHNTVSIVRTTSLSYGTNLKIS